MGVGVWGFLASVGGVWGRYFMCFVCFGFGVSFGFGFWVWGLLGIVRWGGVCYVGFLFCV